MTARVLWLVKGLGHGGAERLLTLMAPKIDSGRFEVEIAYMLSGFDVYVRELELDGIRVHCLRGQRTVEVQWVTRLRELLRSGHYDLVHTHSPVPAAVARVLDRRGTPFIHTEHNVWDRYRWPTYVANAVTYGRNSAVISVSDGVASSVRRPRWIWSASYPKPQTLLHGVNLDDARRGAEARASARKLLGLDPDRPVIGNVANLTPKKDHSTLFAAVEQARTKSPDLVVLIIGDGPLRDDLQQDVRSRGLEENVHFLGLRDDVLDLLPALDVFVLSSRFEGLPISMLEAMASEVPCVVTRVGGIPEAMADEVEGLLVAPGDSDALADALVRLLMNPVLRQTIANAARERVRSDFSIERAVQSQLNIYDRVLGLGRSDTFR